MAVEFTRMYKIILCCIAISITVSPPVALAGEARVGPATPAGVARANPPPAMVRSRLPCIELQVIAYKESRFRQFDDGGHPLLGAPSGIDIMQLELPYRREQYLWDWRANVDAGVALFEKKREELRHHFEKLRRAHRDVPELTPFQLKLATYQYYNGGFYFHWNARNRRWERYGNTAYADDAVRVERMVVAGTPPADWDGGSNPGMTRSVARGSQRMAVAEQLVGSAYRTISDAYRTIAAELMQWAAR